MPKHLTEIHYSFFHSKQKITSCTSQCGLERDIVLSRFVKQRNVDCNLYHTKVNNSVGRIVLYTCT